MADDLDALPQVPESCLDTLPSDHRTFGSGIDPGAVGAISAHVEDEYYPQIHNKNVCYIFNNRNPFQKMSNEEEDVEHLRQSLISLNFQCTLFNDKTAMEIYDALIEVASTVNNVDCFICWIITYGDKHCLYAGEPLELDRLVSPFTGDVCPSLFGKPKLFFFQAITSDREPDTLDMSEILRETYRIPAVADFCFLFSSPPGYLECGVSQLVRIVSDVMDAAIPGEPGYMDLSTLWTLVAQRAEGNQQIPCLMSTLTRHVKFSKRSTSLR
ncbi:caspase-like [Ornithodoros turicata]|uniref:caspase-like n=1 Tax=Ornithodoros turicata TaxID=34597 RepID=UPI0031398ADD